MTAEVYETAAGVGGWKRLLRILALIFSIYVVEQSVEAAFWDMGLLPGAGFIGAERTDFTPSPACGTDCLRVERVAANSPLARAGVASGDLIRFDRSQDRLRHVRADEHIGVSHLQGGQWRRLDIVSIPRPRARGPGMALHLTYDVLTVSTAMFGILILARSGGRTVPLLLGLALVCFGMNDSHPQMWEETQGVLPIFAIINQTDYLSIYILFALFAIYFAKSAGQITLGRLKYAFIGYFIVYYSVGYWAAYSDYFAPANKASVGNLRELLSYPLYASSFVFMYLGWRRSDAAERRRHSLMLVAFGLLVLAQITTGFVDWGLGARDLTVNPFEIAAAAVAGLIAPALFAYAILRHRVFDLGFALNRTLVYGVVSAILLATFGILEWAIERFLPIKGREENALVDAAIALAVFLIFHRVRDAVEHVLESVFFRQWQQAERDLRRFVREAAFITQPKALADALVAALSQFAGGAKVAVYMRESEGYRLDAGGVEGGVALLDLNLPDLVRLRADPAPLELEEALGGMVLISPVMNRNEVIGLVGLGPKPSGNGFRPDETELVAWAVRQVGLDLHALRVERLEQALATANAQIEGFRRLLAPQA